EADFSITDTTVNLLTGGLAGLLPLPQVFGDHTHVKINLPFTNLYADLLHGRLPAIDPLGGPWEVGLTGTMTLFGVQIGQIAGLIFHSAADGGADRSEEHTSELQS